MSAFRSALCAFLLAASSIAVGADDANKPWTGKDIVLKRNGIKIGHSDSAGNQVYVAKLTSISYRVLADRDGFLKVSQGNKEGWFDKDEAVLAQDADDYFTFLINRNPADSQYYARRGWAFYLLGNYDKAASDYSQAIRLRPDELDWYSSRGVILRAKKDYYGAIRDFSKAIQLNPRAAYLYNDRGWAYFLSQEYEKAIADCDECLRLDPNNCSGRNRRGLIFQALGHQDRAMEDFTEVLNDHECAWALNNRAQSWSKKDQPAKAVQDYERSLKANPAFADTYNALAWILATSSDSKVRDGKRAVELSQKASKLARRPMTNYLDTLAAAYAESGQFEEAVRLEEVALQDPDFVRQFGARARDRLKLYRNKKAYSEGPSGPLAVAVPEPIKRSRSSPQNTIVSGPLKGWKTFSSDEGRFSIAFPESPRPHKQRISSLVGSVDNFAYSHEDGEMTFLASYFDCPPDAVLTLDRSVTAYTQGRKGKLLSKKEISFGENTGREIVVQLRDKIVSRGRLYEVGQRRFQIFVEGPQDKVNAEQATGFLDSFKQTR